MYDKEDVNAILLKIEHGFWKSAGSNEFYRHNFADEGVAVLPFPGGILDKHEMLEAVARSSPWKGFELLDPRFLRLGPNCQAVIYVAMGTREGAPTYRAEVSSTYVKQDGTWRLVLHQQTPVE